MMIKAKNNPKSTNINPYPERELLLPVQHRLRLDVECLRLGQQFDCRLPLLLLRWRQRARGRHPVALARKFETRE